MSSREFVPHHPEHRDEGVSATCSALSHCLLPICCVARTPRTPHAALALLLLAPRTHRATTAHAACLWQPRAALHTSTPVPPARRGACTRADQPRTPACDRLERPCTRAPVPPARGACTRAGQRTTTHDDEKMLRAHMGTNPETPIDGASENRASTPATGPVARAGRCLHPPMRAWLEQPHGRHHKAPPQPCALTTQRNQAQSSATCYETPGVKRAPGARGGIAACSAKAPTLAPGSPHSKTPSARPKFPNPISAGLFYGGDSVFVFFARRPLL